MLFPFKVELLCCVMALNLWQRFHVSRCLKHVSTHGNLIGRSVVCHWNYKWMSEMCIISFIVFRSCMFAECVLLCLLWKTVWFVFRLGSRKIYLKFRRCPHYITGDDLNTIRVLYMGEKHARSFLDDANRQAGASAEQLPQSATFEEML